MRAKGYKCNNVKCHRCVGHSMCGELGDVALNCVDRIITRQTNADRIRQMSDFELAKEIENAQSGIEIKNPKNIDYFDCILEWLRQLAE